MTKKNQLAIDFTAYLTYTIAREMEGVPPVSEVIGLMFDGFMAGAHDVIRLLADAPPKQQQALLNQLVDEINRYSRECHSTVLQ